MGINENFFIMKLGDQRIFVIYYRIFYVYILMIDYIDLIHIEAFRL